MIAAFTAAACLACTGESQDAGGDDDFAAPRIQARGELDHPPTPLVARPLSEQASGTETTGAGQVAADEHRARMLTLFAGGTVRRTAEPAALRSRRSLRRSAGSSLASEGWSLERDLGYYLIALLLCCVLLMRARRKTLRGSGSGSVP